MAKVKGPVLSLGGSGQIAKSIVFGRWRGVDYARQHVVPANPNTTSQQSTRGVFASLNEQWKLSPADAQAPFNAAATGRPFTNRNAFISSNLPVLRGETDMNNFIGSPGVRGGLPPVSLTPSSGGAGLITLGLVTTAEPTGWTLFSCVGVVFIQRDPTAIGADIPVAVVEASPTAGGNTDIDFTGLPAGTYVCSAWPVWTKPDGTTAYGHSITTTQVVA